MEVANVLKVLDIQKETVFTETQKFLENFVVYQDKVFSEDLYNVEDALDDINDEEHGHYFQKIKSETDRESVVRQIRMIQQLAHDHDAAYVRLT